MSGFEGMDSAAVIRVAGQLDGQADVLAHIIGSVSGLVEQAVGAWNGQDANTFHGWWTSQHRPHLQAAHDALRGLAQSAHNNATEQDHVSGVSAVGAAVGIAAAGSLALGGLDRTDNVIGRVSNFTNIYGVPKNVHDVLDAKEFQRYEKALDHGYGSVAGWADGHTGGQFTHVVDSGAAHAAGKGLDAFGAVAGGVSTANSAAHSVQDFQHGDYVNGTYDGADAVGSAFQTKGGAVGWLAGTGIKVWTDAGRDAQQIDLSQGLPSPFTHDGFNDWVGGFQYGLKTTASQVWGDL